MLQGKRPTTHRQQGRQAGRQATHDATQSNLREVPPRPNRVEIVMMVVPGQTYCKTISDVFAIVESRVRKLVGSTLVCLEVEGHGHQAVQLP